MKRTLFFLCAILSIVSVAAAPAVDQDLGEGLRYVRVHALPTDLPGADYKPRALVLDLRFTPAEDSDAAALGAWVQFRASAKTPLFILVNAQTARPILNFLETAPAMPGLTTVGAASSKFVPDIAVKVPPVTEKAAYDAFEHGTTLTSLLTDQPGKTRYDEKAIAEEHAAAANPDQNDALPSPEEDSTKPPAPPPLIDATLQRAVHIHRALAALHRI